VAGRNQSKGSNFGISLCSSPHAEIYGMGGGD
jgi:hypothetical protein